MVMVLATGMQPSGLFRKLPLVLLGVGAREEMRGFQAHLCPWVVLPSRPSPAILCAQVFKMPGAVLLLFGHFPESVG